MYSEEFQERFWKKVNKTDTCWLWIGNKCKTGYGRIRIDGNPNGSKYLAHRISLELHLGRLIPSNVMIAHTPLICHNRLCVNPLHLREATANDNAFDRVIDNTIRKGEDVPWSILTIEQVLAIRADPRVQRIVAAEYNISRSAVSSIRRRKSWVWVL